MEELIQQLKPMITNLENLEKMALLIFGQQCGVIFEKNNEIMISTGCQLTPSNQIIDPDGLAITQTEEA